MLHLIFVEVFNFMQVVESSFNWNLESLNSQFLQLKLSVTMTVLQAFSAVPLHSLQLLSLVSSLQGPHLYGTLGSLNPVYFSVSNKGLKEGDLEYELRRLAII